jgi:formylglycine-generating enzyme required for sulfatase activity
MTGQRLLLCALLTILLVSAPLAARSSAAQTAKTTAQAPPPGPRKDEPEVAAMRGAIQDLVNSFGEKYPRGQGYLTQLAALEQARGAGDASAQTKLLALRQQALLDNPLLDFERLILLKRKRGQLGLPTNHQCNSCLKQVGYDNEIAILSPLRPDGKIETLFRPSGRQYVGEIDVNFDADRLLFTMPNAEAWQIHEIRSDGTGLRQVVPAEPDVDNFDACYLPDGRIVYASTASFTAVPCWHGQQRACCLYRINADGTAVRQLCFDQDLDLHPAVLSSGQVIYSRWEYTGIMHMYLRPLMAMNPDGTLQRAVYGSNSYFPNSLFFPRAVPGAPTKLAAILSGYHGTNRTGELVVLDTAKGWHEADGMIHRIAHPGEPIVPVIRDNLVEDRWPKFLHPYPLSEKYFLAAAQLDGQSPWGIYLVDVFGNMLPLAVDSKFDFFEPIALRPTPKPPVLPDRVDLARDDATVYLHNVYAGPGLQGVPRGSVKRLRIVAYHYGYPGMADTDKIGHAGPWEVMRILGTVPVYEDGSASFRVPACTPISVQPLDAEGKALALMRSWYTAMPGEHAACVGCHEQPKDTPTTRFDLAATQQPVEIDPWHGPARGFDFEREVQPVLDRYCVGCHDGQPDADGRKIADLRAKRFAANYDGLPLSYLGARRLDPELRAHSETFAPCQVEHKLLGDRKTLYTPAYDALNPYIRRVNVEDYVGLHVPCEYHADTSELVQMLQKGHHHVTLDAEAWDRLVTWIDLNGPCHGTWNEVSPIPREADRRRRELALKYGGPTSDPEQVPDMPRWSGQPIVPEPLPPRESPHIAAAGWPLAAAEAQRRQRADHVWQQSIDLGSGVTLKLVRIPAGEFIMGCDDAEADESPAARVVIPRDYWMGSCEITNEQFQRFDAGHFSGYFTKRSLSNDGPGIAMDLPQQPAVRVSWQHAMEFCRWLSKQSGKTFTLPTEAQWEYACRAGTASPLNYGSLDADFSTHANVADAAISRLYTFTGGVPCLQDILSDTRYDDGGIATTDVARYQPNAWGLYDMHGNAAEWTRSTYRPYPYREDDGRNEENPDSRKVIRGGSFYDRPPRCRSAFRLSYPAWQRVHNVGFRVIAEEMPPPPAVADGAPQVH